MKNKILSVFIAFAILVGIGTYMSSKEAFATTTKTQAQAVDWAKSLIGTKAVDMDGVYGAQCVDFIQHYYSFLGVSGGGGNARDYATNTLPSGFTRIEDYYGFVPDPGDIAVWTTGSGGVWAGHVGVVISANLSTLTVADVYGSVNETPYRKVHQTTYYYNGGGMVFWGVIRPNFASASSSTPTQTFDTVANGTYFLYNHATDLALNLAWDNDANCENIHTYTYDTTNRGELMSITSCSTDGMTYKIRPIDAKRLVQMYGESPYNGVNICIYDDLANSTQWWKFKKVDNGYAIFIDCDTNYALSSVSGDAVLNTYTGAGNQIWELIPYSPTYTVNYSANGGSGCMESDTFSVGRYTNLTANKFTREKYTFQGWAKSASATTAAYSDKANVADLAGGATSVTLYAVWKANPISTYTINYDGNGNTSGYMNSVKVNYNTSVNLQTNTYKRFGYRFKGWSTNKNAATAQYTDGQSVKNLVQSGSAVTLYAIWENIEAPQLSGLRSDLITSDSVTLLWDESAADGYDVYKDDVWLCQTTSNTLTVTGLSAATTYTFSVMPYVEGASYSVGSIINVTTKSGVETAVGAAGAGIVNSSLASKPNATTSNSNTSPDTSKFPDHEVAAEESSGSSVNSGSQTFTGKPNSTNSSGTNASGTTSKNNGKTDTTSSDSKLNATTSSNESTSGSTLGHAGVSTTVSDNTSASGTTLNDISTSDITSESTSSSSAAVGNTDKSNIHSDNASASGAISDNTNINTDDGSESENSAAKTAGIGAAISSSICALLYFLKKLFGK